MANGWKGLAFPIRFEQGKIAMSSAILQTDDLTKIDESIAQIVMSLEYENPMTGIGVPNLLVFKNFNTELIPYYRNILRERIEKFDKRIIVDDIYISDVPNDDGMREVDITYTLLTSDIPRMKSRTIEITV